MTLLKRTPFLEIDTLKPDIEKEILPGGTIILSSRHALESHPLKTTERLPYWAGKKPGHVFLAQKDDQGQWRKLTYGQAWNQVKSIAEYLLQLELSVDRPIAILSGNSIEHGLLALAAMHIGLPYAPISPAYSVKSKNFSKLKHCLQLLTPGLVFVQSRSVFGEALEYVDSHTHKVVVEDALPGDISFGDVLSTPVSEKIQEAHDKITGATIAKILFTSGSTGLPKGVINTHGNITTNWQQITQTFTLMANGGLNLIDWLPWNHTFGGNHNFGLTLYNGGSLYIDEGNPTPEGIRKTVDNLREIAPTVYFNVPKGFEELIPYLKKDKALCKFFFSQLQMFFYAGASMPQHVFEGLEELAYETIGKRLLIATGLGMTEASPSALFNTHLGSEAGELGVPVPGLTLKLVPTEDKLEARLSGDNITPGYWRNKEATLHAFDNEGFYKTGDALKFINSDDPNRGLRFDGRISEDFKLDTGTWVRVGLLRAKLIAAGEGLIQDAVIAGHDQSYVSAILFPDISFALKLTGLPKGTPVYEIVKHIKMIDALQKAIDYIGRSSTGSSTCIRKAIFANFELSIDGGEITDKGTINQRSVLTNRKDLVNKLYTNEKFSEIVVYTGKKEDSVN